MKYLDWSPAAAAATAEEEEEEEEEEVPLSKVELKGEAVSLSPPGTSMVVRISVVAFSNMASQAVLIKNRREKEK